MNNVLLGLIVLSVFLSGCTIGSPSDDAGLPFFPSPEPELNAPIDLVASAGDKLVELAWNANNEEFDGFNVYRSLVSGQGFFKINQEKILSPSFIDLDLTNNVSYFYVVTVLSGEKESVYSNEIGAIPLLPIVVGDEVQGISLDECIAKASQLQKDLCFQDLALQEIDSSICLNIKSLSPDQCYFNIAISVNDSSVCENISAVGQALRNNCFNDIAIALNNAGICEKILENDVLRSECQRIISSSLQETGDCEIIDDLSQRDDCFEQFAISGINASYCSLVSTTRTPAGFIRDNCVDAILALKKDSSVCSYYIEPAKKYACFETIAVSLQDETICNKISDQNAQDSCFSEVNVLLNQVSICYAIENAVLRQSCIESAALENPSEENCGLINIGTSRDTCFYNLAVSLNGADLCSGINFDVSLRDECYNLIAIALNDSILCPSIRPQQPNLRNECFQTIAINTSNLELCESTTSSLYYIGCFVGIAQSISNDSICENCTRVFPGSQYSSKDNCYYNFAIAENSATTCPKIANTTLEGYCDGNVSG